MNIVFCHGKEGKPTGTKYQWIQEVVQQYLDQGFELKLHEPIDYRDLEDPDARVNRLLASDQISKDTILIGSSMGGYVCAVSASIKNISGLLLLAPALYMNQIAIGALSIKHKPGGINFPSVDANKLKSLESYTVSTYKPNCPSSTIRIIHGNQDTIVPIEGSLKYSTLYDTVLKVVPDNHGLQNSKDIFQLDLKAIINANIE